MQREALVYPTLITRFSFPLEAWLSFTPALPCQEEGDYNVQLNRTASLRPRLCHLFLFSPSPSLSLSSHPLTSASFSAGRRFVRRSWFTFLSCRWLRHVRNRRTLNGAGEIFILRQTIMNKPSYESHVTVEEAEVTVATTKLATATQKSLFESQESIRTASRW